MDYPTPSHNRENRAPITKRRVLLLLFVAVVTLFVVERVFAL